MFLESIRGGSKTLTMCNADADAGVSRIAINWNATSYCDSISTIQSCVSVYKMRKTKHIEPLQGLHIQSFTGWEKNSTFKVPTSSWNAFRASEF